MLVTLSRALACTAVVFGLSSPALAQSGNFALELNSLSDGAEACRLTFVATNNTGVDLAAVSYEVVVWDGAGGIPDDGFLVFEFGQMPINKTKVVQFDIPNRPCNDISRILVNDFTECRTSAGEQGNFCVSGLVAATRSDVDFGK